VPEENLRSHTWMMSCGMRLCSNYMSLLLALTIESEDASFDDSG
jgi:hypothetical protein